MKKWWIAAIVLLLFLGSCGGAPALILIAQGASSTGQATPAGQAPSHVEGIPDPLLNAYRQAATQAEERFPHCDGVSWAVLAGIARVESSHLMGLTGYKINDNGDVSPHFLGPRLDGSGAGGNTEPIRDTDNGRWDDDTTYDRAVGPMQFIPSSWRIYQQDGNGDGTADPHNVHDATLAAAGHLCGKDERNLSDPEDLRQALWSYNNSTQYGQEVTSWIQTYTDMGKNSNAHQASGSGDDIINTGKDWLGTPYLYGGDCNVLSRDRCDCSSLTRYAYRHGASVELPRTTYEQVQLPQTDDRFTTIPADHTDDLRPGDLLFFGANPPWGIHHVGIYIDDQRMLEAPRTGLDIRIAAWHDRSDYYGAIGLR